MSILSKLFGNKKKFASGLVNMQNSLFRIYGVSSPSDAQKMKSAVLLCVTAMAILNNSAGVKARPTIDRIVNETREFTKPLSMRIEELSKSEAELAKILAQLSYEDQVTGSTRVNGRAGFEALYFGIGQELMNDMLAHREGPFGVLGYSTITVVDGIFGEGEAKKHYMEVKMAFLNFTQELTKVI